MAEHDDLLERFQPVLRYDSNEQFFADGAAQYMVNPGNELRRKRTEAGNGAVIAAAEPKAGQVPLELAFLGPTEYADGSQVLEGDAIGVKGRNYREQYRRLRIAHPELNNITYAHAIEANERLWLQYWLWYFYNDYQLSLGLGTHEGDWEMIQLRMDGERERPDIAVYAQHRYGEVRPWDEVERFGTTERPVVYVARGSHAAYFEAGFHQTEAWYDLADGKRRMKHRPALEILGTDEPAWTRWPGRWGDTLPRSGVESDAPTGPGAKRQWTDPDRMLDNPPSVSRHDGTGPRAPDVHALRSGGRLRVEYDVTAREPRPHAFVVTVNSSDERGVPPQTHTRDVHHSGHGKLTTDIVLDPLKHYDVSVSTIAGDPPIPSEAARTLIEPFGARPPELPASQRALTFVSSLVARVRGHRR